MDYNNAAFNELFLHRTEEPEGMKKIAQMGGGWIFEKMREHAFDRKIIQPQLISSAECVPSLVSDELVKIEEVAPRSRAMSVTLRGNAEAKIIRAPRFAIPFFKIESEHYEKTETELLAYRNKITQFLEDNIVYDLEAVEDRTFLLHVEAMVQRLQYEANGNAWVKLNASNLIGGTVKEYSIVKGTYARAAAADDFEIWPLQKIDVVKLQKLFPGKEGQGLECAIILLNNYDFKDINSWTIEDYGTTLASEVLVNGYSYTKLLGTKFVTTIKTHILRPGNLYGFTDEQFLGKFYILQKMKFYIDKVGDRLTFWGWNVIGMGFGNIESAKKLELYSGSVTTTAEDTGYEWAIPVPESKIYGKENIQVDKGGVFPYVTMF